jgi:hypothetical protein
MIRAAATTPTASVLGTFLALQRIISAFIAVLHVLFKTPKLIHSPAPKLCVKTVL